MVYYVRCVFGHAVIHTYDMSFQNVREFSLFSRETVQEFKNKNPDSNLPWKDTVELS